MPTLKIDLIDGAILDNAKEFVRAVRVAHVSDITVNPVDIASGRFDPNALVKALATAGMPQLGNKHPSLPNCYVVRHIFRGLSGDSARCEIIYETPSTGYIPLGQYIIEDDFALQTEEHQLYPDGSPAIVKLTNAPGFAIANDFKKAVTFQRLTPIRQLRMTVIQSNRPTPDQQAAVGTVNRTRWADLGAGYWLCINVSTAYENTSGTYRYSASFMTRQYRDWRGFGWFYDQFGEIPDIVYSDGNQKTIAKAMGSATSYRPGKMGAANGFVSFGPYPVSEFNTIFGSIGGTTTDLTAVTAEKVKPFAQRVV